MPIKNTCYFCSAFLQGIFSSGFYKCKFIDKISPIKEIILQLIEIQGITKTDFCKNTNISYSNLKGKSLFSEIGGEQIGNILNFYSEISPIWLLLGKGSMLKPAENVSISSHNSFHSPIINGSGNTLTAHSTAQALQEQRGIA